MNWRKLTDRAGSNMVLWVAVLFFLLPSLWTIATAFKPPNEYYRTPPRLLPEKPTTYHFYEAFYPEGINTAFTQAAAYWVEEAAGRTNPVTPAMLNSLTDHPGHGSAFAAHGHARCLRALALRVPRGEEYGNLAAQHPHGAARSHCDPALLCHQLAQAGRQAFRGWCCCTSASTCPS